MDSLDFDIPIDTVDTGRTEPQIPSPHTSQTQPYPLLPAHSHDPIGIYSTSDFENPGFDPTAPQPGQTPQNPQKNALNPTHSLESKSSTSFTQNLTQSQKPDPAPQNPSPLGLLGFKYWQSYFDLDQYEFKTRALSALHPTSLNFLSLITEKPDLYGPFWITTFLVFLLDVSGEFLALLWGAILGTSERAIYDFEN